MKFKLTSSHFLPIRRIPWMLYIYTQRFYCMPHLLFPSFSIHPSISQRYKSRKIEVNSCNYISGMATSLPSNCEWLRFYAAPLLVQLFFFFWWCYSDVSATESLCRIASGVRSSARTNNKHPLKMMLHGYFFVINLILKYKNVQC